MDATNYLASLTGYPIPGRFTITTKPAKGDGPTKTVKSDDGIEKQLDIIFDYLCFLESTSSTTICEAADWFVSREDGFFHDLEKAFLETFDKIKNCCYPYVCVPARSSVDLLEDQDSYSTAYRVLLAPISHSITITHPLSSRDYLRTQILRLLEEGFELEVGLSVVPIPLPFAAEHNERPSPKPPERLVQFVQSFFPMTNIADIEDSLVDATFKRRNASSFVNHEYQLFFSRFWQGYKEYLSNYNTRNWKSERSRGIDALITKKRATLQSDPDFTSLFRFDDLPARLSVDPIVTRQPMVFPKRLGFFDALRVDYSLSRLRHYTHTPPTDFQEHVLLVNYPLYVRLFLLRVIAEICKESGANEGLLVVPSAPNRQKTRFEYGDLLDEFGSDLIAYIVDGLAETGSVHNDKGKYERIVKIIDDHFITPDAQMPAYHFVPTDDDGVRLRDDTLSDQAYYAYLIDTGPLPGITLVDIGVGSSNAWNITDHIAVLRPLCWIMVGHCGGLRSRQKVGDYVVANGYVRRDGALEDSVPIDAPVQPARVINISLQNAILHRIRTNKLRLPAADHSQPSLIERDSWQPKRTKTLSTEEDSEVRRQLRMQEALRGLLRAGTVMSVTNRNWETSPTEEIFQIFEQYRVVAIDMESAAVAANAYRYRISHATFLCVSDKPVHGVLKAARDANNFYRTQTSEHLHIVLDAIKLLKLDAAAALDLLHARELRGIDDPPFR